MPFQNEHKEQPGLDCLRRNAFPNLWTVLNRSVAISPQFENSARKHGRKLKSNLHKSKQRKGNTVQLTPKLQLLLQHFF